MSNQFNTTSASGGVSALDMVSMIKSAMQKMTAGIVSVIVDGQTVQWSYSDAIKALVFWQNEAAKELGLRPRSMTINLENSFG